MLQMYYDDLPIWGFIGKVEKILHPGDRTEYKYYLFTHIHFDILYNGKRVIEARSSVDASALLCRDLRVIHPHRQHSSSALALLVAVPQMISGDFDNSLTTV